MHDNSKQAGLIGAALLLAMASAVAQTTPSATASAPSTRVGVDPQTAASASQKAVPRSDTGTVVRTGPAAPAKARRMTDAASGAASSAMSSTPSPTRPAKADRY